MPFISPEIPVKTRNHCNLAAACLHFTKGSDHHPHCRSCRLNKGLVQYSGCTPEGPRCNICISWSIEAFELSKRSHSSRKHKVAPTTISGEGIKVKKVRKKSKTKLSSTLSNTLILNSSMSVNKTSEAGSGLDKFIQATITTNSSGFTFTTGSLTSVSSTARSTLAPSSSVPLPNGTAIPPHRGTSDERSPMTNVNTLDESPLYDRSLGLAPLAAITTVDTAQTVTSVANTGIPANVGVPPNTGTTPDTGTPVNTGTPINTGTPANTGKSAWSGDPGQYFERNLAGQYYSESSHDSSYNMPLLSPAFYTGVPVSNTGIPAPNTGNTMTVVHSQPTRPIPAPTTVGSGGGLPGQQYQVGQTGPVQSGLVVEGVRPILNRQHMYPEAAQGVPPMDQYQQPLRPTVPSYQGQYPQYPQPQYMDPRFYHPQMFNPFVAPPPGFGGFAGYNMAPPFIHPQGRVDGSQDTGCPPPSGSSQPLGSGLIATANNAVQNQLTPSQAQPLSGQQAATSQSTASVATMSRDGVGPSLHMEENMEVEETESLLAPSDSSTFQTESILSDAENDEESVPKVRSSHSQGLEDSLFRQTVNSVIKMIPETIKITLGGESNQQDTEVVSDDPDSKVQSAQSNQQYLLPLHCLVECAHLTIRI